MAFPLIKGTTKLIPHIGFPTESFKAPMIYNPYFEQAGIDACVMPMGVKAEDFAAFYASIVKDTNFAGALITMPHKVTTCALADVVSPTARIAGSANAIKRLPDGRILADMFDGEGFVRGVLKKGQQLSGKSALVVGGGGVGSAIAASLAKAGVAQLVLYDLNTASVQALASRISTQYPQLHVTPGSNDPAGFDVVVNATPLGMKLDDPLPFDISRISKDTFVGEVVMKVEFTPLLEAARALGCRYSVGTDMLFEMIPAYLEFFDLPTTTAENLRAVARLEY